MSDFAYNPHFDGIFSQVALPGRCPLTGQFVSGHEAEDDEPVTVKSWIPLEELHIVDDDENLHGEWNDLHPDRWIGFIGWDEPEESESTQPYEKYHSNPHYRNEEEEHFVDMADEAGLNHRDIYVWSEEDQKMIIDAWIAWRYVLDVTTSFDDECDSVADIGDVYDHLPTFAGRKYTLSDWDLVCDRDHRYYVNSHNRTQKGKPSRFNKRNQVCENHIRDGRRYTHRQMDSIWLWYLTDGGQTDGRMAAEWIFDEFLDTKEHLALINEELSDLAEQENWLNDQCWQYHHSGPMTEAMQNCHGWGDRDPVEVELERIYRELERYSYELYDYDFYDDMFEDYHLEEEDEDPMYDQYEFGLMTKEDELFFDAEAAAREAAAAAFEAQFENLPFSNAVGRRMELAVRSA